MEQFFLDKQTHETTLRDSLEVVMAVVLLLRYLEGNTSSVRRYHDELELILTFADAMRRSAPLLFQLREVRYDVKNRSGIRNKASDVLYHLKTGGTASAELHLALPEIAVSLDEQRSDKTNYGYNRNSDSYGICRYCGKDVRTLSQVPMRGSCNYCCSNDIHID